jgi:N-methylhydantoinase A
MIRIGIDIGGTFTDFVIYHPEEGTLSTFKLPSTPHNPAIAVLKGLQAVPDAAQAVIVHGSTVATNALLERKGARTAFVSTKGFKDIIQIGRQNRPSLYDWFADPPPPLASAELRFEIDERVEHTGLVSKPIEIDDIDNLVRALQVKRPESVAICLLFSYLHPQHEADLAERLRHAGFCVSCSSEVLPEFREYERSSTTLVNAYVSPKLATYLASLQSALPSAQLQVMQSNGGMSNISEAAHFGVRCILSGPAGGIIGASYVAHSMSQSNKRNTGKIQVITFDMGGTSTDVSLIDGIPSLTKESTVGGMPIALPLLDIHTIGAGGGSIASVDIAGALRVGPESAGADPGPACYGIGDSPTVTDANLVLGRILPDHFLGGKLRLDAKRAYRSIQRIGEASGLTAQRAALGVIEVINAHMERALRVSSVEKGYDPREFSLLTFGGAGGLHATDLARRMGIPMVIIPPIAATLSAFGMLAADFIKDYAQTVMVAGDANQQLLYQTIERLTRSGLTDLRQAGFQDERIQIEPSVDMRYTGQSFELNIPFSQTLEEDFAAAHQKVWISTYQCED